MLGIRPHTRPLLTAVQRCPAYRIAAVDRVHARLFHVAGDRTETMSTAFKGSRGNPGPTADQRPARAEPPRRGRRDRQRRQPAGERGGAARSGCPSGKALVPPRAVLVNVDVMDGVVTLSGEVSSKSTLPLVIPAIRALDGVVDVIGHLTYAVEDTRMPAMR